jgi:hypothetical protein
MSLDGDKIINIKSYIINLYKSYYIKAKLKLESF